MFHICFGYLVTFELWVRGQNSCDHEFVWGYDPCYPSSIKTAGEVWKVETVVEVSFQKSKIWSKSLKLEGSIGETTP